MTPIANFSADFIESTFQINLRVFLSCLRNFNSRDLSAVLHANVTRKSSILQCIFKVPVDSFSIFKFIVNFFTSVAVKDNLKEFKVKMEQICNFSKKISAFLNLNLNVDN